MKDGILENDKETFNNEATVVYMKFGIKNK